MKSVLISLPRSQGRRSTTSMDYATFILSDNRLCFAIQYQARSRCLFTCTMLGINRDFVSFVSRLYRCLLVYLAICLFVCLMIGLSICLPVSQSVCLFLCFSIRLYVCVSVCLSVCLSVCVCVCLFLSACSCACLCLLACVRLV